jgi:pimeloyl-ACP methyl ester carboxylesterase
MKCCHALARFPFAANLGVGPYRCHDALVPLIRPGSSLSRPEPGTGVPDDPGRWWYQTSGGGALSCEWIDTGYGSAARRSYRTSLANPMTHPGQQIRFCTSRDGTRIAYATCGIGPPLVWIGHWVRHLEFDWESPVWHPWLAMLTRRNRVVRYDWRGCGLSQREPVEFSLEKHIEDLEAVVDAAGLSRFELFASGGGAVKAMAYTVRHPQHVSHLALYGSQTRGAVARGMTHEQVAETHTNFKMLELGWFDTRPAFGQFFTTLHMPDARAERLRSHNELLRRTTSPANTVSLLRAFFEANVLDIVPQIRCPALVLHAREDAIIPFDEGRLVAHSWCAVRAARKPQSHPAG